MLRLPWFLKAPKEVSDGVTLGVRTVGAVPLPLGVSLGFPLERDKKRATRGQPFLNKNQKHWLKRLF